MSRIGKLQTKVPEGVTVTVRNRDVVVEGPKGSLEISVRPEIQVQVKDGNVLTEVRRNTKGAKAYWGLTTALIKNMVEGVTEGFEKKLELVGVGYRVKQSGEGVTISIGYSHPVEFSPPKGVTVKVVDNQHITVSGIDKQLVGLVAAKIRKIRKPEPYKGKGIRYEDEIIRRKPGKAGKVV